MFTKILIANRGEIACRIIRTCRSMGVKTVAVYSDADACAQHVLQADEAIHIGPAPAAQSYLLSDKILAAAKATGAEAVHPGYGFLSENASFARECAKQGIVFIGPTPDTIDAMGSKSAAKDMMTAAGVPVAPGYQGEDQSLATFKREAKRIGYPVLLKASAGGGGKGMRLVEQESDLEEAFTSAAREAKAAFGDDRFLIEKFITAPRHVEVQVFGDGDGNIVHLFERDCSIQRRHQKVIEEAPAPNLPDSVRVALHDAALKAAQAVNYIGAGTVEFLYDSKTQDVYFMEMNTRLQVEHPVTEAVTGQDLVEWQLKVAAGEKLPLHQDDITCTGHAFEARIYAEDVPGGYLPSVGLLTRLDLPKAARVDTGVSAGDEISSFYDPMILKLITAGDNREAALTKLERALDQLRIKGVKTNASLLARTAGHRDFKAADFDTGFLEKYHAEVIPAAPLSLEILAIAAIARRTTRKTTQIGWRMNLPSTEQFWIAPGETPQPVTIMNTADGMAVGFDDASIIAQFIDVDGATFKINLDGRIITATVDITPTSITIWQGAERHDIPLHDPMAATADASDSAGGLTAPMPGTITNVAAKIGAVVTKGETLVVMEAMKMEYAIKAPSDGTVTGLPYGVGDQVQEAALLVGFDPA